MGHDNHDEQIAGELPQVDFLHAKREGHQRHRLVELALPLFDSFYLGVKNALCKISSAEADSGEQLDKIRSSL